MVVGGLFDAEDLYGPLETYKNIEKNSDNYNIMVFGPWSHGDWARNQKRQSVGNVYFGDDISTSFQKNVETNFFNYFLKKKDVEEAGFPEVQIFDTGKKAWDFYNSWPPENTEKRVFYLSIDGDIDSSKSSSYNTFVRII